MWLLLVAATPSHRAHTLASLQNYTSAAEVPPRLLERALRQGTSLGEPRFAPRTHAEKLASIFTMWNVLDALMWNVTYLEDHAIGVGRKHLWQTGYVREMQLRRMAELVDQPHVAHYCEVGMNGGHSVAAMLIANPTVRAHVFDLMMLKYSWPVARLLSATFGDRFELHAGDSGRTLKPWARELAAASASSGGGDRSLCGLTFVDGNHGANAARLDLAVLRLAASTATRIIVDDIHLGPGTAIEKEQAAGRVQVLEKYGPFPRGAAENPCMRAPPGVKIGPKMRYELCHPWGFVVARYLGL